MAPCTVTWQQPIQPALALQSCRAMDLLFLHTIYFRNTYSFSIHKTDYFVQNSFIVVKQSSFQSELKLPVSLHSLLCVIFAENYAFILQDESQTFHLNNALATNHPFVAYFKDGANTLNHTIYVIIYFRMFVA